MLENDDEQLQRALALGYAHLNRRERTVSEVHAHLDRNGIAPATIAKAIETLTNHGALNDARFVRLFTQDKRELDGWGAERIRRTLSSRGIDRELIDETLATDGEQDRARALLA